MTASITLSLRKNDQYCATMPMRFRTCCPIRFRRPSQWVLKIDKVNGIFNREHSVNLTLPAIASDDA